MPIKVMWADAEHTVILQVFEGTWTGPDYHNSLDEILKMVSQNQTKVDLIGVMTASKGVPSSNLLAAGNRVTRLMEKQVNRIVIVNAPNYFQALVGVVRKMKPSLAEQVHFVKTLEEGYEKLDKSPDSRMIKVS